MKALVVLLAVVAATQAQAQRTTFRDAGVRTVGTATRDSQGTTHLLFSEG